MTLPFPNRPFTGASILLATLLAFPAHSATSDNDKALYDALFSDVSGAMASEIPDGQRLSYPQYEQCFRTYKNLVEFNVLHLTTYGDLTKRQNSLLDEQTSLAELRVSINQSRSKEEILWMTEDYDRRVDEYNKVSADLQADMATFRPLLNQYRKSHESFSETCSEMYFDEAYMKRLPGTLKAEYRALFERAGN